MSRFGRRKAAREPTDDVSTPAPGRHDDLDPDRAALDELLVAFGVEVPESDGDSSEVDDPVETVETDDPREVDDPVETFELADPGGAEEPDRDDAHVDALLADAAPDPDPSPQVITITDEGLPDAVYVQGELDPGSSGDGGAVVFIEDDDTGDAVDVSDALAPTARRMDPKFRDRRIAVRRAEGIRRLRWLIVLAGVVVVVVAALAVLGSPLFAIDADQVRVTGNVYTDPEALQEVIDELVGTPTLIADTRAAERRLEQIPWVAEARVRTSFPSAASIEIRERAALATYQGTDGRFRVIDRDGRVLDVLDGQPVAYMLLTGPDALDLQAGQFTPPGHAAAAELVQALTPSVRGRVSSIEVTGDGSDLRLFLDAAPADGDESGESRPMEVRFGAASDLLVKLVRLETVLPTALERGLTVVDVSTAEVTVR